MFTRGIRNCNPANIRRGSAWKGLSSVQNDPLFCQFDEMRYGIRAFFVLMRTYKYKHQLLTVSDILHRFAPVEENSTFAYIYFVCDFIRNQGYGNCSDDGAFRVNIWHDRKNPSEFLRALALAVFMMETGRMFTDEEIQEGINLL